MQGVTYPLLAVRLEAMGYGNDMIGLSGSMTPLGVLLTGPFFPHITRRIGSAWALLGCLALTIAVLLALPAYPNYEAWLVLRFLLGIPISGFYVVGESGLQKVVSDDTRGRVMGIYNAMMLLGYGSGPVLLSVIGTQGWLPFYCLLAVYGMVAIITALASGNLPAVVSEDGVNTEINAPLLFAFAAPALLFAAGAVAVFDHVSTSLLPLYGVAKGLSEPMAMRVATVALVGAMLGQLPVGWLADRWGVTRVMIACCVAVVLGCGALVPLIATPWVWPLAFLWGAAAFGPLTAAMTDLGRRFAGNMIIIGNVAIGMTFGFSQAIGSSVVGTAMEVVGPDGFSLVLGFLFAFVAVSYVVRGVRTGAFKAARQTAA
jgi:MFS family permease